MPDGLAFDSTGDLFVSCYASDDIHRISPHLDVQSMTRQRVPIGTPPGSRQLTIDQRESIRWRKDAEERGHHVTVVGGERVGPGRGGHCRPP